MATTAPAAVENLVRTRRALSAANVPFAAAFVDEATLLFLGAESTSPTTRAQTDLYLASLPPVGVASATVTAFYSPAAVAWTPAFGDAARGASHFALAPRRRVVFGVGGEVLDAALSAGPPKRPRSVGRACGQTKVSPDGRLMAFMRGGDVWCLDFSSGRERRLTFSAADETCGVVDFSAAEEFGRTTAIWWGERQGRLYVLFMRVGYGGQPLVSLPLYNMRLPERVRYSKAGEKTCVTEPGVVEVPAAPEGEGIEEWANSGGGEWAPRVGVREKFGAGGEYVVRAGWVPEDVVGELSFWLQLLDRRQMVTRFVVYPLGGGEGTVVVTERARHWVNVSDAVHWCKDRRELIFSSERSGFAHLYKKDLSMLASRVKARTCAIGESLGLPTDICDDTGSDDCVSTDSEDRTAFPQVEETEVPGRVTQLTAGDWVVEDIVEVDEARGLIYFSSTIGSPLERQLCVASLDLSSTATQVVQLTQSGFTFSSFSFCDGGNRLFTSFSSCHVPTQSIIYDVAGLASGPTPVSDVRLVEVARLVNPLQMPLFPTTPPKLFSFFADGTEIHGAVFIPSNTVPSPHPTLLVVYGGPGVQTVRNEWALTMQLKLQVLANQGNAAVMIDGRGSSRRGVDFENVFDGGFGCVEVADNVNGIAHLVAQGIVDPTRIGVCGWSYGAYASLMLIAKYPDIFLFAVGGAPVVDFVNYNCAYSERFLGLPEDNPVTYLKSSLLSVVESLPSVEGRLLLAHSVQDENVLAAHSLELVGALKRLKKPYSLALYPNEGHGLNSFSAQLHFETLFFRFVHSVFAFDRFHSDAVV